MMDQTQLELDLSTKTDRCEASLERVIPAQVIDLQKARNQKQLRKMAKVYDSILESVQHLVHAEKRFK